MIEPATLELISEQYRKKRPFVVYSLPDSQEITVILQKNNECYPTEDFTKSVFVFYPFSKDHKDYCIPKEHATVLKQQVSLRSLETQPIDFEENAATKSQYEDLVSKTVSNIKSRNAQKIVVSRKASLTIAPINFEEILYRLLLIYPTAFRYLWYHPETSIWCGVTPEVLLKTSDTCFTTMALAGTQKNDSIQRIEWGEKERNEHQLVIDDIVDKLQSILSVIKVSKTYNFNAGPVVHLRTDITGCIKKGKSTLTEIAASLHPTSAVCGTPRSLSKKFIETHEGYDREYYTGYLGPLREKLEESSIFVNLRCMKIEGNTAHIFVGGGITQDSVPEVEWLETQHKMQTMLSVLQPFL